MNPLFLFRKEMTPIRKLLMMKAVAGGIPISEYTATGNPLSFNTNIIKPLKSLLIPWTPVQSGTGDPYPPGGGKNLFDASAVVRRDGYLLNDRGVEQTTSQSGYTLNRTAVTQDTTYTLSGTIVSAQTSFRLYYYNGDTFVSRTGLLEITNLPYTFTIPTGCDGVALQYIVSAVDFSTIQIEKGESATSYQPYSNIRPISGVSALNVWRTGKNLFDFTQARTVIDCFNLSGSAIQRKGFVIHLPPGTYTLSGSISASSYIYLNVINADDTNEASYQFITQTTVTEKTFTLSDGQYIAVYDAQENSDKFGNALIQLELGQTATQYAPYTGQTYPVTFPALGKNLLNPANKNTSFPNNVYYYKEDGLYLPAGTYTLSIGIECSRIVVDFLTNENIKTTYNSAPNTFTLEEGKKVYFNFYKSGGIDHDANGQLEEGTVANPVYEPYTNTVYGGSLDLTTGVLTVEWKGMKISEATWTYSTYRDAKVFVADAIDGVAVAANTLIMCDCFKTDTTISSYASAENKPNNTIFRYVAEPTNQKVFVKCTDYTDPNDFIAEYGDNFYCYNLKSPIVYPVTPTQITALLGDNVIWTDTNGSNTAVFLKKG